MPQTKCTVTFPRLHEASEMYDNVYNTLDKAGYYIVGYGETKEGRFINISTQPVKHDPRDDKLLQLLNDATTIYLKLKIITTAIEQQQRDDAKWYWARLMEGVTGNNLSYVDEPYMLDELPAHKDN